MPSRIAMLAIVGLALSAGAIACVSRPSVRMWTPDALRAEVGRRAPEATGFEAPFEVPQAAVEQAQRKIRFARTDLERVRALMNVVTEPDGFALRWAPAASGTARETLERGEGNCLALSSVFIGLARSLGLNARYAEIPGLGFQRSRHGKLLITADHIGVSVRTDTGEYIGDFRGAIGNVGRVRRIDDLEAVAHHFNNRGYELLQDARAPVPAPVWEAAREQFALATQVLPRFARAWNNLGVAHARLGDVDAAAVAYRHAMSADPELAAAWRNLGNLELRADRPAEAVARLDRAAEEDSRNPGVHYDRARALAALGRDADAIAALQQSLRLKRDLEAPKLLLNRLVQAASQHAGGV